MKYTISPDRNRLTITVDDEERDALRKWDDDQMGIESDAAMHDFLEPLTCNSELEWIPEGATGDLTSAPMLGMLGEEGLRDYTVFLPNYGLIETGCDGHNVKACPILERWAFMDYQVRSLLEQLRDKGEATLINVDDGFFNNGQRADRADKTLKAWRMGNSEDEADMRDLLSDLMHLSHREGVDFDQQLERARRRFEEEC